TIAGNVFFPDGTRAQGVNVIARRIDANDPDSVLKEAVSQLTGDTFAPRRCVGTISVNNTLFAGLFGECTVLDDPKTAENEGQTDCRQRLNNNTFSGECGFFSAVISAPRPLGEEAENHFVLKGLTPGKYLVQAVQVSLGGFSSPVRSNFGPNPR